MQNNQQFEVELGGKFYLDMRDSHYPHIIGFNDYPGNDFFIKYDVVDEKFYHSGFNSPSDFSDLNNEITENEIISIWELANLTKPDNSLFPSEFWQNCLVLLDYGNHPHLVWGAHPTMSPVSGYKIYRAVHSNPVNPALRNYQLAAATNSSTFS
ncbi:MAG: hypothetical protein K8F36_09915 [Melioribacteraceae bacterium]|nr:hypothetical protein [Melioribacteraceae bacterium]